MSDPDAPKDDPKDPLILRCIKALANVDWKAMAIVLAALAGFGGAIWNKVDALFEKALQLRTQRGVYEVLAEKLDAVAERLEKIELAPPAQRDVAFAAAAMGAPAPEPEPSPAKRLPSFDEIQQSIDPAD